MKNGRIAKAKTTTNDYRIRANTMIEQFFAEGADAPKEVRDFGNDVIEEWWRRNPRPGTSIASTTARVRDKALQAELRTMALDVERRRSVQRPMDGKFLVLARNWSGKVLAELTAEEVVKVWSKSGSPRWENGKSETYGFKSLRRAVLSTEMTEERLSDLCVVLFDCTILDPVYEDGLLHFPAKWHEGEKDWEGWDGSVGAGCGAGVLIGYRFANGDIIEQHST